MVQAILEKEGYDVVCFENGDLLFDAFIKKNSDIVILDIVMPGSDGFSVGAKIRQVSKLPIIVLTGQASDEDYIFGISLGLDVYLTKPVNPAKLAAHVKTLILRAESPMAMYKPLDISYADIIINPSKKEVHANNNMVQLTATEYNLLKFMLQNQERAISREELLVKVWRYNVTVDTRSIDDTLKRLRRKLADAGSQASIDTVRGYGFRLSGL